MLVSQPCLCVSGSCVLAFLEFREIRPGTAGGDVLFFFFAEGRPAVRVPQFVFCECGTRLNSALYAIQQMR